MLLATLFNKCNVYFKQGCVERKDWNSDVVESYYVELVRRLYMIKIYAESLESCPHFVKVCKGFWVSGSEFCDHFHIQN